MEKVTQKSSDPNVGGFSWWWILWYEVKHHLNQTSSKVWRFFEKTRKPGDIMHQWWCVFHKKKRTWEKCLVSVSVCVCVLFFVEKLGIWEEAGLDPFLWYHQLSIVQNPYDLPLYTDCFRFRDPQNDKLAHPNWLVAEKPIWNICSSNWVHLPQFCGVKKKHLSFETTTWPI